MIKIKLSISGMITLKKANQELFRMIEMVYRGRNKDNIALIYSKLRFVTIDDIRAVMKSEGLTRPEYNAKYAAREGQILISDTLTDLEVSILKKFVRALHGEGYPFSVIDINGDRLGLSVRQPGRVERLKMINSKLKDKSNQVLVKYAAAEADLDKQIQQEIKAVKSKALKKHVVINSKKNAAIDKINTFVS